MFCFAIRRLRRLNRIVARAAAILRTKLEAALRRLWRRHGSRVASDPAYAAATAVVISSVLGFVPIKDAIAAVVALVLGVHVNSRRTQHRDEYSSGMSRWDNMPDWDLH